MINLSIKKLQRVMRALRYSGLVLCVLLFYGYAPYEEVPGISSISHSDLMKTVEFLSSPELEGRLSGGEGYNKAAEFAADRFASLNLEPFGTDKYFQYLNVEYNEIKGPGTLKFIHENSEREFQLGKDFTFRGFTGSGNLTADVVFCGYGLSRPDIGYNDYAGVDVKDKIVMVFKGIPSWKLNDSAWTNTYPREKSSVAARYGARGILLISNAAPIGSVLHGPGEQNEKFPQLEVSPSAADDFLAESGYTVKELQSNIDSLHKPISVKLKTKAHINVNTTYVKDQKTMNVAALIEGNDPVLKDEYVIIGAHLDHVGSQAGKIYFPGANDNASGSAAVLEIAEAFIKGNIKPKRSVVFVLFASEEQGLFGASHFAEHSGIPPERITAMLNLDCIGHGDKLQLGNGKSAPELWKKIKSIDSASVKITVNSTWGGGGADAEPFHKKGIPCAYFASTKSYTYLHVPEDKPETLNKSLFEKITKLAFLSAFEISAGNYNREEVK